MPDYKNDNNVEQNEDLFAKYDNLDNLFDESENTKSEKNIIDKNSGNKEPENLRGSSAVISVIKKISGVVLLVIGILFMLVSVDVTSEYIALSKTGRPVDAQIAGYVGKTDENYEYKVNYSIDGKIFSENCMCSIEYAVGEYIRAFEIKDINGVKLIECDNVDVGAYVGALIMVLSFILLFKNGWVKLICTLVFGTYSMVISIAFNQNNISYLSVLTFVALLVIPCLRKKSKKV